MVVQQQGPFLMNNTRRLADDLAKKLDDLQQRYRVVEDEREYLLEKLRQSEAGCSAVLEASGVGMIICDVDGVCLNANTLALKQLEYDHSHLNGTHFSEIAHPENRETLKKLLGYLHDGTVDHFQMELRLLHRKGGTMWARLNASLFDEDQSKHDYIILSIEDMGAYVWAEQKLKYAERKYNHLYENTREAIISIGINSLVVSANPAAWRMFGYNRADDIIGKPISELFRHQKDARQSLAAILDKGSIENLEAKFVRQDGKAFYGLVNAMVVKNDDGRLIGVDAFIRDITDRIHQRNQIKQSLYEKDILLREIHHRVKNNMQVIISLLMLQIDRFEDEKAEMMFKEGINRIRAMSLIHESLFNTEKVNTINFDHYVRNLCEQIINLYMLPINASSIEYSIDDVHIDIDTAVACGLVINELISNSLKHGYPDDRERRIRISFSEDEDMYRLTVSDNGIGFDAGDDWRSTESLGLKIVHMIVERQLRGSVDLETDNGTLYRISFRKHHRFNR